MIKQESQIKKIEEETIKLYKLKHKVIAENIAKPQKTKSKKVAQV